MHPTDIEEEITEISTRETLFWMGLSKIPIIRGFAAILIRMQTRRFARIAAEFDRRISQDNLTEAARWAMPSFVTSWSVNGQENIPMDGPLLIVSNHPGGMDTLSAFAAIPRKDILVVGQSRRFLRILRNTDQHMIYLEENGERFSCIRKIIQSLRQGKAVLIYPYGALEPDPEIVPGSLDALQRWAPSLGYFLKKVPETKLVPVLISGVVSPKTYQTSFARFQKTQKERQRVALFLETIINFFIQNHVPIRVNITIGKALSAHELDAGLDPRKIYSASIQIIRDLFESISPK